MATTSVRLSAAHSRGEIGEPAAWSLRARPPEMGGPIADVRYILALGQVLDSDLEPDMFERTPPIF